MSRETYQKITDYIREEPRRVQILRSVNLLLTGFIFLLYPLFLFVLFSRKNPFLLRAVIVPAVCFAALTVFRKICNAPRPYETYGIPPILEKDTRGMSFPSRHVFSVFMIAMTVCYVHTDAGIMLCLLGAALALIRVIGGVHFPRDVIAGALFGIVGGLIGYYVL